MIRAKVVGITKHGGLVVINSVKGIRGIALRGIIVSSPYAAWYREHEVELSATLSWKHPEDRKDEVIFLDRE